VNTQYEATHNHSCFLTIFSLIVWPSLNPKSSFGVLSILAVPLAISFSFATYLQHGRIGNGHITPNSITVYNAMPTTMHEQTRMA